MNEVYGLLSAAEERRVELLVSQDAAPPDDSATKLAEIEADIAALRYALRIMAKSRDEHAGQSPTRHNVAASSSRRAMSGAVAG